MDTILAVGPRELPSSGTVKVWIDSGATAGYEVPVPVESLRVADMDDGQGRSAIYTLRARECRG